MKMLTVVIVRQCDFGLSSTGTWSYTFHVTVSPPTNLKMVFTSLIGYIKQLISKVNLAADN
jgi:hypothetical protein